MAHKTGHNINCKFCNKEFYVSGARLKLNKAFCSMSCYAKYQEINPSNTGRTRFKKGIIPKNKLPYFTFNTYKNLMHEIKECQLCKDIYSKLLVHHIDENRQNNDISNLVVLCYSCHSKIHHIYENFTKNREENMEVMKNE